MLFPKLKSQTFFLESTQGKPQIDRLTLNGRDFWGGGLEQILIEKAQKGDRAAFSQLLDLHYDFVRSVAWRWCGRTCDVDDVAQDVCIRLAK